jgi:amino-acid N-acetyltransferase
MPLIKMAAFDISNTVMTSLAGEHITSVIGNWVRARGKGVLNGVDYGTSGEIDKLEIEAIRTVLDNGFIPIFPCIGWSIAGKPYNISSIQLAEQIAAHLQADKLFYIVPQAAVTAEMFTIPETVGISADGCVPALNLDELRLFLSVNKPFSENSSDAASSHDKILALLELSQKACIEGVNRAHILNGSLDGSLPGEIFSDLGSGTMIYTNDYGGIRNMKQEDIPGVLRLIQPFVQRGILLPRTDKELLSQLDDFIVYELDGGIRACAALHTYGGNQAEIASVAVDESCSHIGIGPKIIKFLVERAKARKLGSVFVLTTQTADWFEKLGFKAADIATLPEKRKELWTPGRNSKVFRMQLPK